MISYIYGMELDNLQSLSFPYLCNSAFVLTEEQLRGIKILAAPQWGCLTHFLSSPQTEVTGPYLLP